METLNEENEENEEKKMNILKQKEGIVKILETLLHECKDNKQILDTYYENLNKYIHLIQTSVIFLSTVSAFIQGISSQIVISSTFSFIINLVISTYISLTLSLSKFYKLDETKEHIHNIRNKYSDFHNQIKYSIDRLKPWDIIGYVNDNNLNLKVKEWNEIYKNFEVEYKRIIKIKQQLFLEYEKVLDSRKRFHYEKIIMNDNIKNDCDFKKIKKKEKKVKDDEEKNNV